MPPGAGDAAAVQNRVEALAVLGGVDGVGAGAEDGDAVFAEGFRQLDGSLPAKGHDHAERPFQTDDVHHVLRRERFEVKAVGRVEIGADRLGIVVDHHDRVPQSLQRPHAVHGGVVELDALADTDRPAAENDDGPFGGREAVTMGDESGRFVFAARNRGGGVKVRRFGGKFGGACIDHAVDRRLMFFHFRARKLLNRAVEEAHRLGAGVQILGQ